jgi:glycosyltransferase involved in cell wall biosynthesis
LKIRLVFYCHDWFPLVGGVQTITLSLAKGLAEWSKTHPSKSFEVIFVTQTLGHGMDDSKFPFRIVRRPSVREVFRLVWSADLLHLAGPALLPQLFAWILGRPTVIEHHGYQSACPNGLLLYAPEHTICPSHFTKRHYRKCLGCNAKDLGKIASLRSLIATFPRRWLCRRAAANVAVSNHVAMRINLPRTRTIYHGLEEIIKAPPYDPQSTDQLQIGYVGRLVAEKGLPLLLDAAKQLKADGVSFHLTFVGDGTQRSELEASVRRLRLQDRVSFTGELRGSDFLEVLRRLQIIVMPSQWEETAGLAAMEQMMRGGLVVVADVGGLSEVVGDAGLKFAASDSAGLAACLHHICESPELINSLGAAARLRAEQCFSLNSMIERHVELYDEVTAIDRE